MKVREFEPGRGLCRTCGRNVAVRAPKRGQVLGVVRDHYHRGVPCEGAGQLEVGWVQARKLPTWEVMSDRDRGVALAHVMACTTPRHPQQADEHPEHAYTGPGLARLDEWQVCAHAWDQTQGWNRALRTWGAEQVRAWLEGRRVPPEQFLAKYRFGADASLYVVEGRAVGVCVGSETDRPEGWAWVTGAFGPGGRSVLRPDGRTRVGMVAARELPLVEVPEPVRVDADTSPYRIRRVLLQAAQRRAPVEVLGVGGQKLVFHPVPVAA